MSTSRGFSINQRQRSGTIESMMARLAAKIAQMNQSETAARTSQNPPSSDSCTMMVGMASSAVMISDIRSHFATRSARRAACVSAVGSPCACVLSTYPECLPFYARRKPISDTSHQDIERRRSCEEC